MCNHEHKLVQDMNTASTETRYPSRIWGPTCDSADLLFPHIELPELAIGEWLVFQVHRRLHDFCVAMTFVVTVV